MSASGAWSRLAAVLRLRRNLESALTPADQIGSRDFPAPYETHAAFESRRKEIRQRHRGDSLRLREAHGLKSDAAVRRKVEALREQEAELWAACRPDLYPAGK